MSDRSITMLLLVDNTAGMARTNDAGLPFLTFAKVTISSAKAELERMKMRTTLLVAVAAPTGEPQVYQLDQQRKDDIRIGHLDISPSGNFEDVIMEGVMELNKIRALTDRDLSDPYFFPRKHDAYFIFILTDYRSLRRDFYERPIKINDYSEPLFRPDETIVFCDYLLRQDSVDTLIIDALLGEYRPFKFAYDIVGFARSLPQTSSFFRFSVEYSNCTIRYVVDITNAKSQWALPDQRYTQSTLPVYQASFTSTVPQNPHFSPDQFPILSSGKNEVLPEPGAYILSSEGIPFGYLSIVPKDSFLYLLPHNFPSLFKILHKVPNRDQCDAYLQTLPLCYVDVTKQIFKSQNFSYSYIPTKSKIEAEQKKSDRIMALGQRQALFPGQGAISLDPSSFNSATLAILLEDVPAARHTLFANPPDPFFVNTDTADDTKWSSVLPFNERSPTFMQSFFIRDNPPTFDPNRYQLDNQEPEINNETAADYQQKEIETVSEKENCRENDDEIPIPIPDEISSPIVDIPDGQIHERDNQPQTKRSGLLMLETMTILLRERNLPEVRKMLAMSGPLHDFLATQLLFTIERFGLSKELFDFAKSLK